MIETPAAGTVRSASDSSSPVAALRRSRFAASGGFSVEPRLLDPATVRTMFDEACAMFSRATEERRDGSDTEEWRGGLPPRRLLCVEGGPMQDRVYTSPFLQARVSEIVGVPVQASSNRASYSYYCRPGDHLAVHRDVECCDVSVIVAVSDNAGSEDEGGELLVYPDRIDAPLSAIRSAPESGAVRLRLAPGETLVILGGMVPHAVLPVGPEQYRISAPMCFRAI